MKDHLAKKKPKNKKKIMLNLQVINELELEMDYDKSSDGRSTNNYLKGTQSARQGGPASSKVAGRKN